MHHHTGHPTSQRQTAAMIIQPGDHERSPEEIRAANQITRREVLRRVAFGTGALLVPGLLAACVDENFNPLAPEKKEGDDGKREVSTMGGSQPFLSEILIVSFNFPPKGWALCNGQLLPINQNQALFALLGTTYGGNGQTTFALPDLRGRVPIHVGNGHSLGEKAGSTSVTLTQQQLPQHLHVLNATNSGGDTVVAAGNYLASFSNGYGPPAALTTMSSAAVTSVGGSQAHNNMMPYLTLNFIIALQGIFPSRN
jgi:microcystin-dependent protein